MLSPDLSGRSISPCCLSAGKSRARFFAQFILSGQSEILLPQGGIRMTAKDSE